MEIEELRKEEKELEDENKLFSNLLDNPSIETCFKLERAFGKNLLVEDKKMRNDRKYVLKKLEVVRNKIQALGYKTSLEMENERRAEQERKEAELKWEQEKPVRLRREREERICKIKKMIEKIIISLFIGILIVCLYLFFSTLFNKTSVLNREFQEIYLGLLLLPISNGLNISLLFKLARLFSFPFTSIMIILPLFLKIVDFYYVRWLLKVLLIITVGGIVGGLISILYTMIFYSEDRILCVILILIILVLSYRIKRSWTGTFFAFSAILILHVFISNFIGLFPQISLLVIIIAGFVLGSLTGIILKGNSY